MAVGYKGQIMTGIGYKGTIYTGIGYKGVDYSPVTTPPVMTFFSTLITRADVLTAAEFMTAELNQTIKYRQLDGTDTGTLVNEYTAPGYPAVTPLIRGLGTSGDTHMELRCYNDDLTARGGINYSGFSGWGQWPPMDDELLDHGIYIIDLDSSEWFAIAPNRRNSRSGGGAWANWGNGMRQESWASSFANDGAANTYMDGLRQSTTARHMVAAVLTNHDYIPVFT